MGVIDADFCYNCSETLYSGHICDDFDKWSEEHEDAGNGAPAPWSVESYALHGDTIKNEITIVVYDVCTEQVGGTANLAPVMTAERCLGKIMAEFENSCGKFSVYDQNKAFRTQWKKSIPTEPKDPGEDQDNQ